MTGIDDDAEQVLVDVDVLEELRSLMSQLDSMHCQAAILVARIDVTADRVRQLITEERQRRRR